MTRDELLKKICPCGTCDCGDDYESCNCDDCNRVLEEWLYEYDKQIRAEVIDDFVKEICKMIVQSESNGNYRFYACEIKQSIADLAEQLKAGGKNE